MRTENLKTEDDARKLWCPHLREKVFLESFDTLKGDYILDVPR